MTFSVVDNPEMRRVAFLPTDEANSINKMRKDRGLPQRCLSQPSVVQESMNRDLYADRGAQPARDLIYEMLSGGQRAARGGIICISEAEKIGISGKAQHAVSGLCGGNARQIVAIRGVSARPSNYRSY